MRQVWRNYGFATGLKTPLPSFMQWFDPMPQLAANSAQTNDKLRRYATYASVFVAASLIVTKVVAYYLTDSVSLLSSLIDSTVDLLASGVAAYGVAHAMAPPDPDHRYGHGKAEALSALAQGAFIIGSSLFLCLEAIGHFAEPTPIQNSTVGYVVMGFAIVMTLALLQFQKYVVRTTGSLAIDSDRLHYAGDILINLSVVATFALQAVMDVTWVDPLFALGIAGILLHGAYKILSQALNVLMDRELPEADRNKIIELALATPGVKGQHDLRTRTDSGRVFIDMHIEMDPQLPLADCHDISDRVEENIKSAFPNCDILIHQDPLGLYEQRLDHVIEKSKNGQTTSR